MSELSWREMRHLLQTTGSEHEHWMVLRMLRQFCTTTGLQLRKNPKLSQEDALKKIPAHITIGNFWVSLDHCKIFMVRWLLSVLQSAWWHSLLRKECKLHHTTYFYCKGRELKKNAPACTKSWSWGVCWFWLPNWRLSEWLSFCEPKKSPLFWRGHHQRLWSSGMPEQAMLLYSFSRWKFRSSVCYWVDLLTVGYSRFTIQQDNTNGAVKLCGSQSVP